MDACKYFTAVGEFGFVQIPNFTIRLQSLFSARVWTIFPKCSVGATKRCTTRELCRTGIAFLFILDRGGRHLESNTRENRKLILCRVFAMLVPLTNAHVERGVTMGILRLERSMTIDFTGQKRKSEREQPSSRVKCVASEMSTIKTILGS